MYWGDKRERMMVGVDFENQGDARAKAVGWGLMIVGTVTQHLRRSAMMLESSHWEDLTPSRAV